MKSLRPEIKKSNLVFLTKLLGYFVKMNEKPKFQENILKDQTFFSLVKNIFMLGPAYLALKNYPEFKNTWLENEMSRYFKIYLKQEEENKKIIAILSDIAKEKGIPILLLKENNLKQNKNYIPGSRFSTDVDVLIRKSDVFKIDEELFKRGLLLHNVNFLYDFYPPLTFDENRKIFKLTTKKMVMTRRKEIKFGLNNFKNFNYFLPIPNRIGALLEIHFFPNQYYYHKKYLPLKELWKYKSKIKNSLWIVDPAVRILSDADHFMLHLRYRRISENGLNTFLGNLKRLYDLSLNLNLENNIDWEKFIYLAQKYNISAWGYYYLFLGKKFFNIPIPFFVFKKLKKQSSLIKKWAIKLINTNNLLHDKRNLGTNLFVKMFLKPKSNSYEKKN